MKTRLGKVFLPLLVENGFQQKSADLEKIYFLVYQRIGKFLLGRRLDVVGGKKRSKSVASNLSCVFTSCKDK